jgi:hypothetical protein
MGKTGVMLTSFFVRVMLTSFLVFRVLNEACGASVPSAAGAS